MDIRHSILSALVAAAFVFATAADAKGPRGKPAAKPKAKATSAAPAPAPGARPGAGATARPGTPGQGPRPGMMHVKPGHNPNARVTFNVPATTAGSATATRPNSAPRTTAGSATAIRPNTVQPPRHAYTPSGNSGAARDTRRDAGSWRPVVTPSVAGSRTAPRDTRRDAGRWPAVTPAAAPASGALKPPSPAQAPTRKDARPPEKTGSPAAPQPSIQQVKSSKNAQGDGRVSTKGQGPKPAADNARQLADYMMIESAVQQQRAPKSPKE